MSSSSKFKYDNVSLYGYILGKIRWNIFGSLDNAYFESETGLIYVPDAKRNLEGLNVLPRSNLIRIKHIPTAEGNYIDIMIQGYRGRYVPYMDVLTQLDKYIKEEQVKLPFDKTFLYKCFFRGIAYTFEDDYRGAPIFECRFSDHVYRKDRKDRSPQ